MRFEKSTSTCCYLSAEQGIQRGGKTDDRRGEVEERRGKETRAGFTCMTALLQCEWASGRWTVDTDIREETTKSNRQRRGR